MLSLLLSLLALAACASTQPFRQHKPLTLEGDFASEMVKGIGRFLDAETQRVAAERRFLPGAPEVTLEEYRRTIEERRKRHAHIIGLRDTRVPVRMSLLGAPERSSLLARAPGYEVHAVRWSVLAGMDAEGLLLEPSDEAMASVVAIPDADWTPEQLAGLAPGVSAGMQSARKLAEQGIRVLVPVLIDRRDEWSGDPRFRFTNQPHREYVYRMAYEMGRHIIGYEVQKVLAAVDWLQQRAPHSKLGVWGYGEGALVALHASAADARIDAAVVSGYFEQREHLWREPIYRNTWARVKEFGDAELAGLVAPRALVIDATLGPSVTGPPAAREGRRGAAPGGLQPASLASVRAEWRRAETVYVQLGQREKLSLVKAEEAETQSLARFLEALTVKPRSMTGGAAVVAPLPEADERMQRQLHQMVTFTQAFIRPSEQVRKNFWNQASANSAEAWTRSTSWYRDYYWREVIGKLPTATEPLLAEIRETEGHAKWRRYDVKLALWKDVFAYGVLLLPRDLKDGEARPVVVCQHGLEGQPDHLINPKDAQAGRVYNHFAANLADDGFVVFVPQLPYIGDFRVLQRKANPLGLSIYSFILAQHERILDWLEVQPFVDAQRIGFYGLSYGGKTALRVPPLLDRYALSICSGDFNEWVWKVTTVDFSGSYMFTQEWEIGEFDTANTFNHSDLAKLMAPRPFMVERGHRDGVGVDEWVAWEYAKVRRFYDELGLGALTEIEYFNGPHEIHGVGTFAFLRRHLRWPAR
jgi:dienelactone hydrolase